MVWDSPVKRIEEKNPLKQGLKQYQLFLLATEHLYWREESIKTRIETPIRGSDRDVAIAIEEKNPLKQGLKPSPASCKLSKPLIEEKNPLKQGLKPSPASCKLSNPLIEEKNPLKQGLKQFCCFVLL